MITGHLVRSCGIYAPLVCGHEAVRLQIFGDEATELATPLVMFRAVVLLEWLLRLTDWRTSMEHPPQLDLLWKIAYWADLGPMSELAAVEAWRRLGTVRRIVVELLAIATLHPCAGSCPVSCLATAQALARRRKAVLCPVPYLAATHARGVRPSPFATRP